MADKISFTSADNSECLYSILKECVDRRSIDSLTDDSDCGASVLEFPPFDYFRMVSVTDSFGENILEENGRISLAYENLRSIPRKIADKYANKTKFLDLSYNNFSNLSFLMFFDRLHTLILDRNLYLEVNTLPFLPNLRILWINNCSISNISDWLNRVEDQCPRLQQLSMMENPGLKSLVETYENMDQFREYVFNKLPSLKYLDGIPRETTSECLSRVPSKSSTDSTRTNLSNNGIIKKSCASIKLSDLFRFKRRKKPYTSS